jgi:hypothetical protein
VHNSSRFPPYEPDIVSEVGADKTASWYSYTVDDIGAIELAFSFSKTAVCPEEAGYLDPDLLGQSSERSDLFRLVDKGAVRHFRSIGKVPFLSHGRVRACRLKQTIKIKVKAIDRRSRLTQPGS